MSHCWQYVSLRELLNRSEDRITINPQETYREITIRLWGKGVTSRREVVGAEIAAGTRFIARKQQFILSRIDARNGAFGLVPDSLDGAVVTNDFPVFNLNTERLLPRYLELFGRTADFIELCKAASEGTTNRIRLKEERFLAATIPLPELEEQRRIVARIEELAAKIEEARGLRMEALIETERLAPSASGLLFDLSKQQTISVRLEEVAQRITKGESPEWQGYNYQESGVLFIRSENVLWGALDFSKRVFVPSEFHRKLGRSQLKPGDVLINLVGASIGRACMVPNSIQEANVNQAVAVISPTISRLDGRYLMRFLISSAGQKAIHSGKVETARPNISLSDLRNLSLPLPALLEQRRIVAYLDNLQAKVDALKKLQAETAAQLDALLPSILDKAFKGEL